MSPFISLLSKFKYSFTEWRISKFFTAALWLYPVIKIASKFKSQPYPESICRFFNCSFITQSPFHLILICVAIALVVLYIAEKYMHCTLFFMAAIGIVLFSLERSNGFFSSRNEIVSVVFIAQFFAYLHYYFAKHNLKSSTTAYNLAVMYSVQTIAASYMIAGISKIQSAGYNWIHDAPNISVRIIRAYSSRAIDLGRPELFTFGRAVANFVLNHPNFLRGGFLFVLLIEFCAFIAMFGKREAKIYSILLLFFHVAVFVMLGVIVIPFLVLMLVYLFNLPLLLQRWTQRIAARFYNN